MIALPMSTTSLSRIASALASGTPSSAPRVSASTATMFASHSSSVGLLSAPVLAKQKKRSQILEFVAAFALGIA